MGLMGTSVSPSHIQELLEPQDEDGTEIDREEMFNLQPIDE